MIDRVSFQVTSPFAALGLLVALTAPGISCSEAGRDSPPDPAAPDREAGFAIAQSLRFDLMRQADSVLAGFSYVRTTEMLTMDEAGDTLAFERLVVRHRGNERKIIDETRRGPSRPSIFSTLFVEYPDPGEAPSFRGVIPENPEFASARHRDSYLYDVRPGPEAGYEILEIRTSPDAELKAGIQHARLEFDASSRQVIRLELERDVDSFLYRSTSVTLAALASGLEGRVLPSDVSYVTQLDVPLRRAYRAAVHTKYSEFEPLLSEDR